MPVMSSVHIPQLWIRKSIIKYSLLTAIMLPYEQGNQSQAAYLFFCGVNPPDERRKSANGTT